MDSSNRLKEYSPHDKVKDRIEELYDYFNSFMADLTEMREFYATQDDNKTLGDDILERGVALVADTNRMLIMYDLDKQIASRVSSLEEPLDLKNIIAGLESEICRFLKIKEELAEETIRMTSADKVSLADIFGMTDEDVATATPPVEDTMIKEEDLQVDISSHAFMPDKIIKRVTHKPSGLFHVAIGDIATCNREINEWLDGLSAGLEVGGFGK